MNRTPSHLAKQAAKRRRQADASGQPRPGAPRPLSTPRPAEPPLAAPYAPVVTPMYQTMSGSAPSNATARPAQPSTPPQRRPTPVQTAHRPPRQPAPPPRQASAPAPQQAPQPAANPSPRPTAMPPSSRSAASVFHPAVEPGGQRSAYQELMRKHDQVAVQRRQSEAQRPQAPPPSQNNTESPKPELTKPESPAHPAEP